MVAKDEEELNNTIDQLLNTKLKNQFKKKQIEAEMDRQKIQQQKMISSLGKEPADLPSISHFYK